MPKEMDYKDFTLKAIVKDPEEIEKLLKISGAVFKGEDHQKDTYFKAEIGKLKLREGTIENLITHYRRIEDQGIERTIVYQYDLNPSTEQIEKLLADYAILDVVNKIRKIYFIGNVKIHLDTTPDNKSYVEIEAIDNNGSMTSTALRNQCIDVKEKLKLNDLDMIKTGYSKSTPAI